MKLSTVKTKMALLLSLLLMVTGCEDVNWFDPPIDGLSLYWYSNIFGANGRGIGFEFYGTKEFKESYQLKFNYSINGQDILISLEGKIDKGKCHTAEPFWGNNLCTPTGRIFIPEKLLSEGTYTLTLKTSNFTIISKLIVGNDKIDLNIPPNKFFSSSIPEVYRIPLNLLFGNVVYSGDENTQAAESFLNDLLSLGLNKARVSSFLYNELSLDQNGNAINSFWPPDNYSLGFIYSRNHNFKDIVNLAVEHFNKANINIYMSSSEGDEANLSKIEGITIKYAD
jgi:hypothetical protein